jgi:hypothetical protein
LLFIYLFTSIFVVVSTDIETPDLLFSYTKVFHLTVAEENTLKELPRSEESRNSPALNLVFARLLNPVAPTSLPTNKPFNPVTRDWKKVSWLEKNIWLSCVVVPAVNVWVLGLKFEKV